MPKNKTWNDWSKADESRYSMLYSYLKTKFKDLDEFTFIDEKKRGIMSLIENNNNWADKTKEAIYFMVAKYLKASNYLLKILLTSGSPWSPSATVMLLTILPHSPACTQVS